MGTRTSRKKPSYRLWLVYFNITFTSIYWAHNLFQASYLGCTYIISLKSFISIHEIGLLVSYFNKWETLGKRILSNIPETKHLMKDRSGVPSQVCLTSESAGATAKLMLSHSSVFIYLALCIPYSRSHLNYIYVSSNLNISIAPRFKYFISKVLYSFSSHVLFLKLLSP